MEGSYKLVQWIIKRFLRFLHYVINRDATGGGLWTLGAPAPSCISNFSMSNRGATHLTIPITNTASPPSQSYPIAPLVIILSPIPALSSLLITVTFTQWLTLCIKVEKHYYFTEWLKNKEKKTYIHYLLHFMRFMRLLIIQLMKVSGQWN